MCTSFIHAIQLSCFMKVWRYSETYLHRTSLGQAFAFGIYMRSVFTELTNISYIKLSLFRILLYRYSGFGWDWFHFTKQLIKNRKSKKDRQYLYCLSFFFGSLYCLSFFFVSLYCLSFFFGSLYCLSFQRGNHNP
jgi:hypothetical protein